jgi:hypothetical protein
MDRVAAQHVAMSEHTGRDHQQNQNGQANTDF